MMPTLVIATLASFLLLGWNVHLLINRRMKWLCLSAGTFLVAATIAALLCFQYFEAMDGWNAIGNALD
ncbi:MAG: hypothetical protein JXB62_18145 [Pirellulales bacterium]|nr:hypothetical protein [Pirellulales bacterium]